MNPLVAAKTSPNPLAQKLLNVLAIATCTLLGSWSGAFAAGINSVSLAWDPNPETNVTGYRLSYGLTSGSYSSTVDAGAATDTVVNGLHQGTTYYFVVSAYNTFGQVSAPSSEISYTVPGTPNTAPTANSFSLTVTEDGQGAATLGGTDAEGDGIDYSIVSAPGKGTLSGTAPNLTYKPAANATGSDSFTYRTHDGILNSATATVTVTITPVNDAPVAAAKSATLNEDASVSITLSGTDVDGDTLSYAVVTAPTKGLLVGTPPNLTYQPSANLNGSDSFTYRVNDGTVNSATATVSISITPVNDVPVAQAKTATTAEDTGVGITLSGTDVEGSTLTYAIVSAPGNGTLSGSGANITYTPKLNFSGSDSFTYRVNDGTANSAVATVNVTVTPVNDAPVASPRSLATNKNTAAAVTVTGTDAEGSALTYTVVSQPSHGALSGTAPNLTYTPTAEYTGSDSFTFRVHDGTVNSAVATVSISVNPTNTKPVADPKSLATMKNKAVAVKLSGTDAEAQALSFRIVNGPAQGSLSGTPPNVKYTPSTGYIGTDGFSYVVNDGITDSTVATVNLKVKATNRKPVATRQAATVNWNTASVITVAGGDADGDVLTFRIVKAPAKGTISGTAPNFIYTPPNGFKGKVSFTFLASDGFAKSAAARVDIMVVNPNNKAPVALDRTLAAPAKKTVLLGLQGTDADGDKLTFRLLTRPAVGKLTGKGAAMKYKLPGTLSGPVTFTYVANDGFLDSAPATVTITIAAPATTARSIAAKSKAVTVPGDLPVLTVRPARPGVLTLQVTGTPGGNYALESSANLSGWEETQQLWMDDNGSLTVEIPVPAGTSHGFFRLRTP